MKKLLVAAMLSGSLMLGGCGTTTTAQVNTVVSQVQAAAVQACGFLPAVETVTAILASFIPGVSAATSVASQVANSICNAVVPAKSSMSRGAAQPTVNGVPIQGVFVR